MPPGTKSTRPPSRGWSLTSLKEKLIKIGAQVGSHGRYIAFQPARSPSHDKCQCREMARSAPSTAVQAADLTVSARIARRSCSKPGKEREYWLPNVGIIWGMPVEGGESLRTFTIASTEANKSRPCMTECPSSCPWTTCRSG